MSDLFWIIILLSTNIIAFCCCRMRYKHGIWDGAFNQFLPHVREAMYEYDLGRANHILTKFWPTHWHVKSGNSYELIGHAEAQVSTGMKNVFKKTTRYIQDGDIISVYKGYDGKLWVRFREEFYDGRFKTLTSY